ncbi:MAG: hypothetical protein FJ242_02650 [Nitrospira sp.]|nr:hypothetical protein [Nitrospira sp.]
MVDFVCFEKQIVIEVDGGQLTPPIKGGEINGDTHTKA